MVWRGAASFKHDLGLKDGTVNHCFFAIARRSTTAGDHLSNKTGHTHQVTECYTPAVSQRTAYETKEPRLG